MAFCSQGGGTGSSPFSHTQEADDAPGFHSPRSNVRVCTFLKGAREVNEPNQSAQVVIEPGLYNFIEPFIGPLLLSTEGHWH